MSDVYCQTHVGEVETIAQPDEGEGNDVVSYQLLEILARLLQLQHQDNRLLRPVTSLEQIVGLEKRLVFTVGEALKHGGGVEVPQRRAFHDVQTERTENAKVHSCVDLLHEAGGLTSALDSAPFGQRTNDLLHHELARKGEHDGVERDEGDILLSLSVHDGTAGGLRGLRVGEEDGAVHGV